MRVQIHPHKTQSKEHPEGVRRVLEEKKGKFPRSTQFLDVGGRERSPKEVERELGEHIKGLKQKENKFFDIQISLSSSEAKQILGNEKGWKDFVGRAMDVYAQGLEKGVKRADLVYYGRLEAGKEGARFSILVSRRNKDKSQKLSPLGKPRQMSLNGKSYQTGMNKEAFGKGLKKAFDKSFQMSPKKKLMIRQAKKEVGELGRVLGGKGEGKDSAEDRRQKIQQAIGQIEKGRGEKFSPGLRQQMAREMYWLSNEVIALDERTGAVPIKAFIQIGKIVSSALLKEISAGRKRPQLRREITGAGERSVRGEIPRNKLRSGISKMIQAKYPQLSADAQAKVGASVGKQASQMMKQSGLNSIPMAKLANLIMRAVQQLDKAMSSHGQGMGM